MFALALSLGGIGCAPRQQDFESLRHAIFAQAWSIIGANYYDRSMNGLDWEAVRRTYESKVIDQHSSIDLYWNVLRPMTELLETSHVMANPPPRPQVDAASNPQASGSALSPEACGGLLISFGPRGLRARIMRVNASSLLRLVGVRAGWRLVAVSARDEDSSLPRVLSFMSTDGNEVEVDLSKIPGMDRKAVSADLDSLGQLRAEGADSTTELEMDSLGISIRIGRNTKAPFVVDVLNGSEAARAGIEPGSTFTAWQSKQAGGGEILFIGDFRSPEGKPYSATFKFQLRCDIQDRAAEVLPGDILHLRFDTFRPDVVSWLDEQLLINPRAVILDLRRNVGGDANAMQEVLSRFLARGARIAKVVRVDREEIVLAGSTASVFTGPLAILLSPLSASASEVSASALRIHGRALLYGQDTLGNVLLANSFQLIDGGIVQVATADIRSVDGRRLEDVGVKVDRKLMPTLAAIKSGHDIVLEAALADLRQALH